MLALVLALSATVGLVACAPEPSVTLERSHDLVALLWQAEITGTTPYPVRQLAFMDDGRDDRDALAYVRAPPGTAVTWPGLPTWGPAQLSFGYGAAWLDPPPTSGSVRFVIAGRRAGDAIEQVLFDEVVDVAELPRPSLRRAATLDLPGVEPTTWTLRFATHAVEGEAQAAWPGWFAPVVSSEGHPSLLADHPVVTSHVATDLLAALPEAQVVTQVADDPVRVERFDAGFSGHRSALRATAPSRVRYVLTVPEGGMLAFGVGMHESEGWPLGGDGMEFAVELDGTVVWEQTVDAYGEETDRVWQSVELDLDAFVGQTVQLDLVTRPRADPDHDVGGWARPRLLGRREVPRRRGGDGPNVFVLLIDTLRADRVGSYGAGGDPTPRLDALAREGLRFGGARSVSSWTWPSTASLFTGLEPLHHGVVDFERAYLVDGLQTMAEIFAEGGYTTGAFVANQLITTENNFDQGFETFVNTPSGRARALNERVRHWLDNHEGQALFGFVHYYDPHDPYLPPAAFAAEPLDHGPDAESRAFLASIAGDEWDPDMMDEAADWWRAACARYEAEVRYVDTAVGELVDELERRGLLDDALVVVVSDHGEEFLEHAQRGHGSHLYEESVRVPLIVTGYGPSALTPSEIAGPIDLTDVLPTLCALAGLPGPAGVQGSAIEPAAAHVPDRSRFAQTSIGAERGQPGFTDKLSVLQAPWKLIYTPATGRAELYQLEDDPEERIDRGDAEPERRDRMLATLAAWRAEAAAHTPDNRGAVSEDLRWWLEELGYVDR